MVKSDLSEYNEIFKYFCKKSSLQSWCEECHVIEKMIGKLYCNKQLNIWILVFQQFIYCCTYSLNSVNIDKLSYFHNF